MALSVTHMSGGLITITLLNARFAPKTVCMVIFLSKRLKLHRSQYCVKQMYTQFPQRITESICMQKRYALCLRYKPGVSKSLTQPTNSSKPHPHLIRETKCIYTNFIFFLNILLDTVSSHKISYVARSNYAFAKWLHALSYGSSRGTSCMPAHHPGSDSPTQTTRALEWSPLYAIWSSVSVG